MMKSGNRVREERTVPEDNKLYPCAFNLESDRDNKDKKFCYHTFPSGEASGTNSDNQAAKRAPEEDFELFKC